MNIRQAHKQFIRECQDGTLKRRSGATVAGYENAMRLLLDRFPISDADELTEGVLRQFFKWGEAQRGWKPATTATYRKNLSVFVDWCIKRSFVSGESPLKEIPYPVIPPRIPEFYSEGEIEKILYAVDQSAYSDFERARNMAMFGVLLMAGLRRGELIQLKVSDVNLDTGYIRIRSETAKNRKPRAIGMTIRLKELLTRYWEVREKRGVQTYAFWVSSTRDAAFTKDGLKHLLARLSHRTAIHLKANKFRHTYATEFYRGSQDIVGLSQTMGHKDISTTMIYAHAVPEHTKKSLENNPINNLF